MKLYTSEEIFNWTADMDWITGQIACGGQIGSAAAMRDLKRQGVSHVLNLSAMSDDGKLAEPYRIKVCWNHFPDDLLAKPPEIFERGVNFARAALAKKENRLYIHCAAGYHRAPMMTLAVLCAQGWAMRDAMRHIRRCRPCVGFPAVYVRSVEQFLESV